MKGTVLITDSLFIFPEHEEQIRAAGYEIERLDKPEPSSEELVTAIKGKVGYILGGVEHVTEEVIDAADELKVISFTGIGYKDLIPAWEYATNKGIAITNAPDGPTHAVAEWAIGMAVAMNRGFFEVGRVGEKSFMTTKGIEGQHVGIIGFGRIGKHIAEMLVPFRPSSISYTSRHAHLNMGLDQKSLDGLLADSDILFLCVSKDAGTDFLDARELALMKDGALLVSFMHPGIVNEDALLKELESGRIRAASDNPAKDEAFKKLSLGTWYSLNASNAFNTATELKLTSDMTVTSLLNVLEKGTDQYKVN
ncbi:MAG: hypothetical protein JWO84_679 [Parcubacteria group bacterium]|nr:hypothetical protein [Parcubacteria group bacterium]